VERARISLERFQRSWEFETKQFLSNSVVIHGEGLEAYIVKE